MTRALKLYSRKDCGLCEEMKEALELLLKDTSHAVDVIDIDIDLELRHLYGARIPVLIAGDQELCEVKLNVKAVQAFLCRDEVQEPF